MPNLRRWTSPGGVQVGALSLADPPVRARQRAQMLCQQVEAGVLDEAFEELAAADWETIDERPLATRVRETVADVITLKASKEFEPLLPAALHTLAIAPMSAKTMVLDTERVVHLVRERVPDDDAMGELLRTACGQELWSDVERPLRPGLRGGWQDLEPGTAHCERCAEHAHEFPETRERHDDPDMPYPQAHVLARAVTYETRREAGEQMEHLCHLEPAKAVRSVADSYREWLVEALAVLVEEAGEKALRDLLLRYFDRAAAALRAIGSSHANNLCSLMTRDDWRAVVINVVDDLRANDEGAVARTYLYTEIRALVAEKVRRIRAQALR